MEISKTNDKGTLIISEEVLSSIATNAAKDVDGVASFSNRPVDVVNTIKKGSLKVMSPVRILPDGDNMDVSIYVNVLPNKEIKTVAENVQKAVKEAVENMTGKEVSKVNVVIAGIDFAESGEAAEPLTSEK
ncbi:MAG: Asp23/Gls24 family envelope stress response protein [Eubacterium sp.]